MDREGQMTGLEEGSKTTGSVLLWGLGKGGNQR